MFIVLITKSYDKSVWCNFSVHCHYKLQFSFFIVNYPLFPQSRHGDIQLLTVFGYCPAGNGITFLL